MKNKLLYISFSIALQMTSSFAMDSCCDQRNLESIAKRYALTVIDGGEINEQGIVKDLQFLSPEALKEEGFKKYIQEDSFQVIAKQATTKSQKQVVNSFTKAFNSENIENDKLLRTQLSILLDKVIVNLKPPIPVNIYENPIFKSLKENPLSKCQKMLLPLLAGEPTGK